MIKVAADTNPGDRNDFHPYCEQLNAKRIYWTMYTFILTTSEELW